MCAGSRSGNSRNSGDGPSRVGTVDLRMNPHFASRMANLPKSWDARLLKTLTFC